MELGAIGDAHKVAFPVAWKFRLPNRISNPVGRGSELPMEYLSPQYSVRITIVTVVEEQIYSAMLPYLARQLSGFSTADR
jgi:hypothetical protein